MLKLHKPNYRPIDPPEEIYIAQSTISTISSDLYTRSDGSQILVRNILTASGIVYTVLETLPEILEQME